MNSFKIYGFSRAKGVFAKISKLKIIIIKKTVYKKISTILFDAVVTTRTMN